MRIVALEVEGYGHHKALRRQGLYGHGSLYVSFTERDGIGMVDGPMVLVDRFFAQITDLVPGENRAAVVEKAQFVIGAAVWKFAKDIAGHFAVVIGVAGLVGDGARHHPRVAGQLQQVDGVAGGDGFGSRSGGSDGGGW